MPTRNTTAEKEGFKVIDGRTLEYKMARATLADRVRALNGEIDAIKRRHLRGIVTAVDAAADARKKLETAIATHKALFNKPKTRTLNSITVGYRKLVGSLTWDDAAKVVGRIKKLLPGLVEVLIKVEEKPNKEAIAKLSATEVKRLGVTIEKDSDVIVIKPADSDIDKLVDALMKEREGGDA
jgi:hypothetical protein